MSETAQQNTYLDIDPTPERNPTVPARKYGDDGEATLESLRQFDDNGNPHVVKFGRDAGKKCLKARISILTSEYGFVTIFDDWLLEGAGNFGKNRTLKFLSQLGIDPKTTRDAAEHDKMKILVDVSFREWDEKDRDTGELTGEKRQANGIKNVWRRP